LAAAELLDSGREQRRLCRLSTRLTLAAGTTVEEELVESDVIDVSRALPMGTTTDRLLALVANNEQRVAEPLQTLKTMRSAFKP
jgi:hypothetical protein